MSRDARFCSASAQPRGKHTGGTLADARAPWYQFAYERFRRQR